MTSDPVDRRLARSKDELAVKMARFCTGRVLDRQLISDVMGIYEDHRTRAKLQAIPFPEMILLILDEQCQLRFTRRDLTEKQIDNLVIEIAQRYPRATPAEIARAVRRAYPHHRPPGHLDTRH